MNKVSIVNSSNYLPRRINFVHAVHRKDMLSVLSLNVQQQYKYQSLNKPAQVLPTKTLHFHSYEWQDLI
jgi:hypothetical protein